MGVVGTFPHLDTIVDVRHRLPVLVYAIFNVRSSRDHPLGEAVETFIRREGAERFIEEVREDDSEFARWLQI